MKIILIPLKKPNTLALILFELKHTRLWCFQLCCLYSSEDVQNQKKVQQEMASTQSQPKSKTKATSGPNLSLQNTKMKQRLETAARPAECGTS